MSRPFQNMFGNHHCLFSATEFWFKQQQLFCENVHNLFQLFILQCEWQKPYMRIAPQYHE